MAPERSPVVYLTNSNGWLWLVSTITSPGLTLFQSALSKAASTSASECDPKPPVLEDDPVPPCCPAGSNVLEGLDKNLSRSLRPGSRNSEEAESTSNFPVLKSWEPRNTSFISFGERLEPRIESTSCCRSFSLAGTPFLTNFSWSFFTITSWFFLSQASRAFFTNGLLGSKATSPEPPAFPRFRGIHSFTPAACSCNPKRSTAPATRFCNVSPARDSTSVCATGRAIPFLK